MAFKVHVIQFGGETGNLAAGRELCVSEGHICHYQKQKDSLFNANSVKWGLWRPKNVNYGELEKEINNYRTVIHKLHLC